MRTQKTLLVLLIFLLSIPSLSLANIGKIILTSGKVFATQADGKRKLRRGSKVFQGDSIITEKKSRAQIRFIDGALVSLRENSVFKVIEYKLSDTKGSSSLKLIKGGFRTVTGLITKKTDREYNVNVGGINVDVSGTYWGGTLSGNDKVYLGVWQGNVFGKTETGKNFNLGENGDTNYALIDQDGNVIPLQEQPDDLDDPNENSFATDESQDDNADQNETNEDNQNNQEQNQENNQESNNEGDEAEQDGFSAALDGDGFDGIGDVDELDEIEFEAFIDKVSDINQGVTLVDGIDAEYATDAARALATDDANYFGYGASDGAQVGEDDEQEVGGVAHVIDGDSAAIGNRMLAEQVTKMVSSSLDSSDFVESTTPGGVWTANDANIGLIYGKWLQPVPVLPIGGAAELNDQDFFIALAKPISGAGTFTGQTFNTIGFQKARSGVNLSAFSMVVAYDGASNLALSNVAFTITTPIDTYTNGTLGTGPYNFASGNFTLNFSGTSSGQTEPYSGVFKGSLTGSNGNNGDDAGIIGGIDIQRNNGTENVEVVFGVSK